MIESASSIQFTVEIQVIREMPKTERYGRATKKGARLCPTRLRAEHSRPPGGFPLVALTGGQLEDTAICPLFGPKRTSSEHRREDCS